MKATKHSKHCLLCQTSFVEQTPYRSSIQLKFPICNECIGKIYSKEHRPSDQAIKLYLSLRQNGVNAKLEKYDGFKTVDIAIESAKLYIEVDGLYHYDNYEQALIDLQRTIYSLNDGYTTLRIPNALVDKKLKKTTEYIVNYLKLSEAKISKAS